MTFKDGDFLEIEYSMWDGPDGRLIATTGEQKAKSITAVVPYVPYGRQDKKFQDGEATSAKTLASLFKSAGIDEVITVDVHFHRRPERFDFHGMPFVNVSAGKLLVEDIRKNACPDFTVIGPDFGSSEIIEFATGERRVMKKDKICPVCGKPATGCKCELREKSYEAGFSERFDFKGKDVVILDDMIVSGTTMIKAVDKLRESGARKVIAAASHGLFLKDSLKILQEKTDYLVVADSIETPVSGVSIAPLISGLLKG